MEEKERGKLKEEESRYEEYGRYGAWAVVFGLIVEIVCAFFNDNETAIEKYSLVFANSLIALGVFAEIYFGRKSQEVAETRSALLEKEAADARLRTAEIERLTAWRRVTPEQREQIQKAISGIVADLNVRIDFLNGDPETFMYAHEVGDIFRKIGVSRCQVEALFRLPAVFGVHIVAASRVNAVAIKAAFDGAGIDVEFGTKDISEQFAHGISGSDLYFFVGPKKPPHWPDDARGFQ